METLLEQQRRFHEERERIVDQMVKENLHKKSSHREHINSEQRNKQLLDRYMECTESLREMYEDQDGQRKEEIQSLSGPNEFVEFYNRLKGVKEFYRKHPNEISVPMSVEFEEYAKMRESNQDGEYNTLIEFRDEEGYGKYLDLHQQHEKYLNLKGIERVDYITYLGIFDRLFDIPKDRKGFQYRNYLESLLEYLYTFLTKIKPLTDFDTILGDVQKEFLQLWDLGQFPGWPKETHAGALAHTGAHLDLSAFSNWQDLSSLGLDRLKSALIALGLKCGGTLEERAQRLFSTKGKSLDSIDPNLFAKSKPGKASGGSGGGGAGGGGSGNSKEVEKNKDLAMLEAQVYRFAELLSDQRAATKENVTRKQARTAGENEESDEEEGPSDTDDDDDDEAPYNPKNLPLGWDGKPIPYWLYKLHGLNISYICEICGNFTYKGPKAFQRHFAEWRHAHGMRCLGIPNTAHFANVTQIEDALQLWEKLKGEKTAERWQGEHEEEFEDTMGNVVNKKTFEDLKRQGLL